jgi:hypothetical protein
MDPPRSENREGAELKLVVPEGEEGVAWQALGVDVRRAEIHHVDTQNPALLALGIVLRVRRRQGGGPRHHGQTAPGGPRRALARLAVGTGRDRVAVPARVRARGCSEGHHRSTAARPAARRATMEQPGRILVAGALDAGPAARPPETERRLLGVPHGVGIRGRRQETKATGTLASLARMNGPACPGAQTEGAPASPPRRPGETVDARASASGNPSSRQPPEGSRACGDQALRAKPETTTARRIRRRKLEVPFR